jgi:hypothetical protein
MRGPGKGKTNNPNGRPKGSQNQTTKEAHELFVLIMNRQVPLIESALKKIEAEDSEKYINALSKLLQYYMPRKTDVTSGDEKIAITLPDIVINSR